MTTPTQQVGHPYKVRLVSVLNSVSRLGGTILGNDLQTEVVFENTPRLSEVGSVTYTPVRPIQMPGATQIYQGTEPRSFSITATFISRTAEEATRRMADLQTLRSWRYPFFGTGTSTRGANINNGQREQILNIKQQTNQPSYFNSLSTSRTSRNERDRKELDILRRNLGKFELRGAPPEVLFLYAYSNPEHQGGHLINLNRIPVVLTNLSITYPDDVEYIPTLNNNEPFPLRMEVGIDLAETHSPQEFAEFSLSQYKRGDLEYF
jgi:hypothetical protein